MNNRDGSISRGFAPDPLAGTAAPGRCRLLLVTTLWWPSAALLALKLRQAGFTITLLCPRGHPACAEPTLTCRLLSAHSVLRSLRAAITAVDPAMIVPMDDRAVSYLHQLHARSPAAMRDVIVRSLGDPAGFPIVVSRAGLVSAARAAGLMTPAEVDARSARALDLHFSRARGPLMLKIDGLAGGQGVARADNAREARNAARRLRLKRSLGFALKWWMVNADPFWLVDWRMRQRADLSAQYLVPGKRGDLAMFCRDGAVLGIAIAEAEAHAGETGPSTFIRLVERPGLAEKMRRLAATLRLSGFHGVDFIIDAVTGEEIVIELNPRITSLCAIEAERPGMPIAAAAMALLGAIGPSPRAAQTRDLYAHFPIAWNEHPHDRRLALCEGDIPSAHSALLAELRRPPWSRRGHLGRFGTLMAHRTRSRRSGLG